MKSPLFFFCFWVLALAPIFPVEASPPAAHHHSPSALSGVHSLDVYADDGTLHVLQGQYHASKDAPFLLYLCSKDGGDTWSTPVQVDKDLPGAFAARRGMDAQICAHGDKIMAVWMSAGTDKFGGGPMVTSLSEDGGKTWKAGPNPADDGSTEGHGFIDAASDKSGAFHLTWLDNRKELRGLRYARSTDHGKTWSVNTTPDEETCECCWNTMATASNGTIAILYRDKAPRDMAVTLSANGSTIWEAPKKIGNFNWEFNGCPHVGGGIAIDEVEGFIQLHTVVWTGQAERVGIYHLSSNDGGETWAEPIKFGGPTSSHPDIAVKGQEVIVVWDEQEDGPYCVHAVRSHDGGKTWSEKIELSTDDASATHPRVVSTTSGFRVFWTAQAEDRPSTVQSVTVE